MLSNTLCFTVAGYFTWRTLLEGSGVDGVVEKLRARWKGALVASWQFWPAVNVFNFAFVPYHFRVLYTNCLSLFWSGYLSHMNARRLEHVKDA
jgi:antibiotic biosynthesis monooxygenase (ABM) superfamily enzyme